MSFLFPKPNRPHPVRGLDENALRETFRVEFIAPDGTVESGVDGGGLFKAARVELGRGVWCVCVFVFLCFGVGKCFFWRGFSVV